MARFSAGTLLQAGDNSSPMGFNSIAQAVSINGPTINLEAIDTTSLDDAARINIGGLFNAEADFELNFLPDDLQHIALLTALASKNPVTYRINWPNFATGESSRTFIDIASTLIRTATDHGMSTGRKVWFETTDTLPTTDPAVDSTTRFFAHVIDSDTLTIHTTSDGAYSGDDPIEDWDNGGAGTHTIKWGAVSVSAVDTGTNIITTEVEHDFRDGQPVQVTATVLPTNVLAFTTYYAIRNTATTVLLAATNADAINGTPVIDLVDSGTAVFISQGNTWEFLAHVTGASPSAVTGDKLAATVTLNVTDSVTLSA